MCACVRACVCACVGGPIRGYCSHSHSHSHIPFIVQSQGHNVKGPKVVRGKYIADIRPIHNSADWPAGRLRFPIHNSADRPPRAQPKVKQILTFGRLSSADSTLSHNFLLDFSRAAYTVGWEHRLNSEFIGWLSAGRRSVGRRSAGRRPVGQPVELRIGL